MRALLRLSLFILLVLVVERRIVILSHHLLLLLLLLLLMVLLLLIRDHLLSHLVVGCHLGVHLGLAVGRHRERAVRGQRAVLRRVLVQTLLAHVCHLILLGLLVEA